MALSESHSLRHYETRIKHRINTSDTENRDLPPSCHKRVSIDHGVWRHRLDLQLRRSQRQQDRDGVIDTGVRVDNYAVRGRCALSLRTLLIP